MHWKLSKFEDFTSKELYEILRLRQEVFIVEQTCWYLDNDGLDYESWHLCAYEDGNTQPIAYARLLPKGIAYENYASIGRVISRESHRGTGLGRKLMDKALKHAADLFGEDPLKIAAQVYLMKFYESLGFRQMGESYLLDGIPHVDMKKI